MRLLVIMKRNLDQSLAEQRNARYLHMIEIYKHAGFEPYLSYAESIDDIKLSLNNHLPDLVLCGIDHLPENGCNISHNVHAWFCLLYTSDAADDLLFVDLCGRRIIKKKTP